MAEEKDNNNNKTKYHAKVVSFINMKGGVSKTTLTKEIGYHLSKKGKKVLMFDIDPQINLTQSLFEKYNYAQSEEIVEKIKLANNENKITLKVAPYSIKEVINSTVANESGLKYTDIALRLDSNLYLIPGELGVEFVTRSLGNSSIENSLYNYIEDNDLRRHFDYIFIDCPPTYSSYTIAAIKASDYYLVPVRADAYSLLGINMLFRAIHEITKDNRPYFKDKPLKRLGIILTDIEFKPKVGKMNLIADIRNSDRLKQSYIFKNTFLHNMMFQRHLEYFIDDSSSEKNAKPNLNSICNEFERRIKEYEQ